MNIKFKNYLLMHLVIVLWGGTAVLGALIPIDAMPLVFLRMFIASICIILFMIFITKQTLKVKKKVLFRYLLAGVFLALHWFCFFKSIKVSNVSIALITLSTGAFFTAIVEPIWIKRKVINHEIIFGVIVILGLVLVFNVKGDYLEGILYGLLASFLSVIFSILNSRLVKEHAATQIGFYQLITGAVLIILLLVATGELNTEMFTLKVNEWVYMILLALVCTAFAYVLSIKVMEQISPFTLMLSVNLEPVYGIILAYAIFGEKEKMDINFYLGALVILLSVIFNGIIKLRKKPKL